MTDRKHRRLAAGCAVLFTAGCAVLFTAGCAAAATHHGNAGTLTAVQRHALAARYLAIAQSANRKLDHDFDGQRDAEARGDLAAAEADLRAAAGTERAFDRQLNALAFPPSATPFVRLLYRDNQARAALTATAANAMTLSQLRGFQPRLNKANQPVEDAVQVIRDQLDLPPPDTS